MRLSQGTLYALVVACEIAFWAALCVGLAFRYLLQWRRASRAFLWAVPSIDIALLVFTVMDLRAGTNATFAHGLATAYVGFTIAFGSMLIRWTDQRFAHKFAGGPTPATSPAHGWPSVLYELKLWGRCLIAVAITWVLLSVVIALVAQPSRTQGLEIWYRIPLGTAFFWFVFGPLWQMAFFKHKPTVR